MYPRKNDISPVSHKFRSNNINLGNNYNENITNHDNCPSCGNTKPAFYHFQNGMLICFICRKASISNKEIQAY